MTETVTLTDRYVEATLSWVPPSKRADIDRELRASIADAVDARVEAGEARAEAEVAVLTELGDPARLAAGYVERPLHLIGPALFLDYIRLLRTLLVIVVPIAAAAVLVVQLLQDGPVVNLVGSVVSTIITTALHVFFWTTLVFALLERLPGAKPPLTGPWTPDRLPEPRVRRPHLSDLIAEAVWVAFVIAALLLAPSLSPERDGGGNPINILNPWLWDAGVVYVLIGLVALGLVVSVASYYQGRWTVSRTVAAAVLEIALPSMLIWLASNDRMVNPAFVDAVGWQPSVIDIIHINVIILGAVAIVAAVIKAVNRLRRR